MSGRPEDSQLAQVLAELGIAVAPDALELAFVHRSYAYENGGIDTNELNAATLEVKRVPGLYFIGEVVDVTGWLGGYNFQWAWASGAAAGRSA